MLPGFRTAQLVALMAVLPGVAAVPHIARRAASRAFQFQRDGVLGTSLDLTFVTPSERDAQAAEGVALAEIERLRRIISVWDSTTEVSRLMAGGRLEHASPDLIAVLNRYEGWRERTGNAYSAGVGRLVALWREAQRAGRLPDSTALATAVAELRGPAWRVNGATVTMLTRAPIDLNSLGKGYVIDCVAAAVRERIPSLRGGLINIGGDIRTWGESARGASESWHISIADPLQHADNAAPLTQLRATDRAVSSSGNYERGFDIAGKHWSHILDPRTGYPVDHHVGVTVIADDNATANALATALSVLPSDAAMRLVAATPGVEALIVTAAGTRLRSAGFARYEVPAKSSAAAAAPLVQGSIAFDITPIEGNRHRPYVAMWITDTAGTKHVRTLAFWGSKPKYQKEMSRWWGAFGTDGELVDAVTRATRPLGKYTLDWDGLDQKGAAVAPGLYRFWLEAAYEDGPHSVKSVIVNCSGAKATGAIDHGAAFAGGEVTCSHAGQ